MVDVRLRPSLHEVSCRQACGGAAVFGVIIWRRTQNGHRAADYERIFGHPCDHIFRKGGFGRNRHSLLGSGIGCGVTGEGSLIRQYNQELGAAHGYRALALWCKEQNFKGFACYFDKQAAEEHTHAKKIAGHLIDRRTLPETAAMSAPKCSFKSLLEAARHAHAMEQANTQGINSLYETALVEKDYPAQVLMHWFISEQVEEERWSTEMVERVETASCAGSISDLDRHLERLLAERLFAAASEK